MIVHVPYVTHTSTSIGQITRVETVTASAVTPDFNLSTPTTLRLLQYLQTASFNPV